MSSQLWLLILFVKFSCLTKINNFSFFISLFFCIFEPQHIIYGFMEFEEAKKRYYRFLKENGVYTNALKKYRSNAHTESFSERLKATRPIFWLTSTNAFCYWAGTKEGDTFWWAISLLWQYECVINDIFISPCERYEHSQLRRSLGHAAERCSNELLRKTYNVPSAIIDKLKSKLNKVPINKIPIKYE